MKQFVLPFLFFIAFATTAVAETPTVHCPTEPPNVRRLQLQERWRIDADDSDSPILGNVNSSSVLVHDGRVYILDGQLCHILVYSDDGKFQGTILHEGDGPGEVRDPNGMFLCSDGRIGVKHGYPTKLEFVDLDGTPRGRWRLQSNAWANRIQETPLGWFAVYTESKQSEEPGVFLSIFHAAIHDEEGQRIKEFYSEENRSYHQQTGTIDEADEYTPWLTANAVGDSHVVYAPERDEYRLEWRNFDGEITRVVTREFAAHKRTQAQLDRHKYTSYSIVNGNVEFKKRKLCEYDPMIMSISPLPEGRVRVTTSFFDQDLPEGMVCRYEIHEPSGELSDRVEIYDPSHYFDWEYDYIALLDDDSIMVLRNVRPAFRAAIDARLHPDVREKMPPIPDEREDIAFTPITCDPVPYQGGAK